MPAPDGRDPVMNDYRKHGLSTVQRLVLSGPTSDLFGAISKRSASVNS
jgi:hypothetical protein